MPRLFSVVLILAVSASFLSSEFICAQQSESCPSCPANKDATCQGDSCPHAQKSNSAEVDVFQFEFPESAGIPFEVKIERVCESSDQSDNKTNEISISCGCQYVTRGVPFLSNVPYVDRLFKNVGIAKTVDCGSESCCAPDGCCKVAEACCSKSDECCAKDSECCAKDSECCAKASESCAKSNCCPKTANCGAKTTESVDAETTCGSKGKDACCQNIFVCEKSACSKQDSSDACGKSCCSKQDSSDAKVCNANAVVCSATVTCDQSDCGSNNGKCCGTACGTACESEDSETCCAKAHNIEVVKKIVKPSSANVHDQDRQALLEQLTELRIQNAQLQLKLEAVEMQFELMQEVAEAKVEQIEEIAQSQIEAIQTAANSQIEAMRAMCELREENAALKAQNALFERHVHPVRQSRLPVPKFAK